MLFVSNHRQPPPAPRTAPAPHDAGSEHEIVVWVDPDLVGLRRRLAGELGDGFRLQSGAVPQRGIVLVAGPSPGVIAGLRRSHPGPGLLAVMPYGPCAGPEAAALLDAGADDVATSSNVVELALRIRAIARRL